MNLFGNIKKTVPIESARKPGFILLGASTRKPEYLELRLANRHGLVTGATGTGKTVTLQVIAEGFSRAGVPVFAADIKGDLSGIGAPGERLPFITERCERCNIDSVWRGEASPVRLWDIFGNQGHPIRANVQEMGPLLLARMLQLNEVQEGVLNVAFRIASDKRLPLSNLADFRTLIFYVSSIGDEIQTRFGNVASRSVGAIQRQLLVLENQGAAQFLGEPALDINDLIALDANGRGVVNLLAADELLKRPRLYATFLLWLLTRLWESLPEIGDPDKPRLVFFFDEAHLLFSDAPPALLQRIEQIARLVRSKGVGVYFVTQNPRDVPDSVSAQLGNRIQHALRAYTPRELRGIKAAADTFRPNPALDTERVIQNLKTGEALVSTLMGRGEPSIVQRTLICPPQGRIGPLTIAERRAIIEASPLWGEYETIEPESELDWWQAEAQA